jgi:hypothetical protein
VILFLENGADVFLRAEDGHLSFETYLENTDLRCLRFTSIETHEVQTGVSSCSLKEEPTST